MTGRDWDLQGSRLAGFRFAEWLVRNGGPENFGDESETDSGQAWVAAVANGWVEEVRRPRIEACRPDRGPRLTGEGRLEVDRVRRARSDPQARASACREALLLWLAHAGRGAGSAVLIISRDDWRFFDTPFTVEEVNRAAGYLQDNGLVDGWSYTDGTFMAPRLTAKGTQCVEFSDADVRDFLYPVRPGGTVNYQQHIHGDVHGQVAQGENVTQTQNNGIDTAALSEIFKAMREALPTVEDPDDREDMEHGIQELEAAAESGDPEAVAASAGRLRRLATRIGAAAGNTAITVATTEGVEQVLGTFGLG